MKAHYIIQGNKTTSMPENMARLQVYNEEWDYSLSETDVKW